MASLRFAFRPHVVTKATGRLIAPRSHVRFFSDKTRRLQEAARPTVRTDGPLYAYVPQPVDYTNRVTIDIDGKPVSFDSIFLRDSCVCPDCVDVSSSQKNFQTCDIPSDIQGSFQGTSTTNNGVESAIIRWNSDVRDYGSSHNTIIPMDFLRRSVRGDERQHIAHFKPSNRVFWDKDTITRDNIFVDFADYESSDKALFQTLKQIESHGLAFLKNVPDCSQADSSASMNKIISRIGSIRSSFYGLTWDVRSVPKAINVAYTHQYLGLHMDLCYMDLTPQYQFLHSLRARAPGGESLFSDSFKAAETLRSSNPDLFEALVTFPVTFHYYNDGQSYRQVRTTVELTDPTDLASPIKNLNWSPPFQGPFAKDIGNADEGKALRKFLAAAHKFDDLISAPENVFELRMNEGECVIFDNRRVLHARRAFDVTKGERWLKGAYLDRDVFASKLARLEETYGH